MSVSLDVQHRELRPRSVKKNLRQEGRVIGSVYGYEIESTPISIDRIALKKALRDHGSSTVFTFELNGKTINALIAEQNTYTFKDDWVNVDLYSVNMNKKTEFEVEIIVEHEDDVVKATGGILTQNIYTVLVSATPSNIPEHIIVDAASLKIGDDITVADLPQSDKYDLLTDDEEVIIALEERQEIEEEETTEAAPVEEAVVPAE